MHASPFVLEFCSDLAVPQAKAWQWITSVEGITAEMMPLMRMSVPRGVRNITTVDFEPGKRLFRSYIFLFGVLPFDFSDLTLTELTPGVGFVEESPMGSMKSWKHVRTLEAIPGGTRLKDSLTFEPRFPPRAVTRWFIQRFFAHRHKVLRRQLG